jgi:acid phosphatase class B
LNLFIFSKNIPIYHPQESDILISQQYFLISFENIISRAQVVLPTKKCGKQIVDMAKNRGVFCLFFETGRKNLVFERGPENLVFETGPENLAKLSYPSLLGLLL